MPFQTNISGVTLTGVAPADFGAIRLQEDGTPTLNGSAKPIIPHKQVKVSHNVTTVNQEDSALLLDNLSHILGLNSHKSIDHVGDPKSSKATTSSTTASSITTSSATTSSNTTSSTTASSSRKAGDEKSDEIVA